MRGRGWDDGERTALSTPCSPELFPSPLPPPPPPSPTNSAIKSVDTSMGLGVDPTLSEYITVCGGLGVLMTAERGLAGEPAEGGGWGLRENWGPIQSRRLGGAWVRISTCDSHSRSDLGPD